MTEREKLIQEHQKLTSKIFEDGLNPIEKLRLIAIRRRLDELDSLNEILAARMREMGIDVTPVRDRDEDL